jgi:hypothetical protein
MVCTDVFRTVPLSQLTLSALGNLDPLVSLPNPEAHLSLVKGVQEPLSQ